MRISEVVEAVARGLDAGRAVDCLLYEVDPPVGMSKRELRKVVRKGKIHQRVNGGGKKLVPITSRQRRFFAAHAGFGENEG